jgi:hypothetical protein
MPRGAANSIRQLRAGEAPPAGARKVPSTYKNAAGYLRERWQTGERRYVERYQHRGVARPTGAAEVDHRDGNPANNTRSNLRNLSPSRHAVVGNLRRRMGHRSAR